MSRVNLNDCPVVYDDNNWLVHKMPVRPGFQIWHYCCRQHTFYGELFEQKQCSRCKMRFPEMLVFFMELSNL